MFKSSLDNKRYNNLSSFYKGMFGEKIFKISLNAGFTCPSKCIYCSLLNSGEYAGNPKKSLKKQFNEVKKITDKWNNGKYIAYFQAGSNTNAPLSVLKEKYEEVLGFKNVIGLGVATRSDSISNEVLDYLEELNKKTFLTVELGLQSAKKESLKLIRRGHSLDNFEFMFKELKKRDINVIVHIINGLPNETKEDMINTVKYLNKLKPDGIKIHMLQVLKNTVLEKIYKEKPFHLLSLDEYVDIVCSQLELLDEKIVIHRLTGDPKEDELIAPNWVIKKHLVINAIDKEMIKRQTYQGINLNILNRVKLILERRVKYKDLVIDATVGNGNDTLFLADLVKDGHVFGFDIQEVAIKNTDNLLKQNKKNNYTLYKNSHAKMFRILKKFKGRISVIVFNLGYLPKGNKKITTKAKATVSAIKNGIKLLNQKGIILIVIYKHEEGLKEEKAILKLLEKYKDNYKITEYKNSVKEESPYLITIEV